MLKGESVLPEFYLRMTKGKSGDYWQRKGSMVADKTAIETVAGIIEVSICLLS